jgi:hypothetical protein
MKTKYNWTRINSDVNGNPRYVLHWTNISKTSFQEALKLARPIGGKKFHNKQYGGGIVFQSYNLADTEQSIEGVRYE